MNGAHLALRRWRRFGSGLLAVLAFAAFGAALAGDFVFDDVHSVAANPALHDLTNFGRFWTDPSAFSGTSARMYRPALLSSFALNWAVSPEPWSLKLGNVLLHAANAVLLFHWIWRLGRHVRAALAVAAVFAVHPLASEAINMVSARSELLATTGMLLALNLHLVHRQRPWLAAAGCAFGAVLACGSKETGVVLPVLLFAQVLFGRTGWPDRRELLRAASTIAPALAVVAAYLVARKLLLGEVAVELLARSGGDPVNGYGRTLSVQLATMGSLLPRALLQCLWPLDLSMAPKVRFESSFAPPLVWLGWTLLVALTAAAALPGARARLRRVGLVFVWLVALPWIVIPLNMPYAEHRMYGPLAGLAAIAAAVLPGLVGGLVRSRRLVRTAVAPAVLLVLLLPAITLAALRSLEFRDECTLWRVEIGRHGPSFGAYWGLGTALMRSGDVVGSIEPMAKAHELNPGHYDALRTYVEALLSLPDERAEPDRSLRFAKLLAARGPEDPWVRTLHVHALLQKARIGGDHRLLRDAERLALSCLEIAPPKGYVYQLAATARRGLGDLDGALLHLDTAIARGLAPVSLRLDRAALLQQAGRHAEARDELLRAQRDAPLDPRVLHALRTFAGPPR